MTENEIISLISSSYNILSQQRDFSPKNEILNKTLSNLVLNLIDKDNLSDNFCEKIMSNKTICNQINPIRDYCQKAECQMEKYWSEYFAKKENLKFDDLREFWYFNQYYNITLKENEFLEKEGIENPNIIFLGSGPLPMTGVILSKIRNCKITLVDIDKKAIELSKNFCDKISTNIEYINSDAIDIDYSNYDVVFVASMISNKGKLIKKLFNDDIKNIIIRDAKKFSKLFYEELESDIFNYYKIKYESIADGMTINTSYFLEK